MTALKALGEFNCPSEQSCTQNKSKAARSNFFNGDSVSCYVRLLSSPPTQKTPYGVVIDGVSLAHVFKGYTGMYDCLMYILIYKVCG